MGKLIISQWALCVSYFELERCSWAITLHGLHCLTFICGGNFFWWIISYYFFSNQDIFVWCLQICSCRQESAPKQLWQHHLIMAYLQYQCQAEVLGRFVTLGSCVLPPFTSRCITTVENTVESASQDSSASIPDVTPRIKFKRLDKTAKHIMQARIFVLLLE